MTVPTTIPDTRTPRCPECRERAAVRRVVDPERESSHRCGRCAEVFQRV